jgi:hypothetical protein
MAYISKLTIKFVIINVTYPLQEIKKILIEKFGKKYPSYDLFVPMSKLTKVPFWTSHFKFGHFDWSFWLVFLLNHHDNNVIWAMIKNIYYSKFLFKMNMKILIH